MCLILCAAALSAQASAPNGFVSTFSVPPFEEEATVVGIDGWELISSGKPDLAIVRRSFDSQTGLLLRTHGIQKNLEEPLDGLVTVTVVMQFGLVSESRSASHFFIMPVVGVGVGSAQFGFSNADISEEESAGFFYTELTKDEEDKTTHKRVCLLPREAIFEGAKFTLSLAMDLFNRSYVLTISGVDWEGKPIEVKSPEIFMDAPNRIPAPGQRLTGIRLASGLPASTELFVESIKLAPTP